MTTRITLFFESNLDDSAAELGEWVQSLIDEAVGPGHVEVTHLPARERV